MCLLAHCYSLAAVIIFLVNEQWEHFQRYIRLLHTLYRISGTSEKKQKKESRYEDETPTPKPICP